MKTSSPTRASQSGEAPPGAEPSGGPSPLLTGDAAACLVGRLRALPPRGPRQFVALVSGWSLVQGLASFLARLLLGYRRSGELSLSSGQLVLTESLHFLGRVRQTARTVVSAPGVTAVRLSRGLPTRTWGIAIASLCLGTYVGTGFLLRGLLAAGLAPSLLGLGLLFVGLGLLVDFALLSGLTEARSAGQGVLRLEFASGRGIELSLLDASLAEALVRQYEESLEPEPNPRPT